MRASVGVLLCVVATVACGDNAGPLSMLVFTRQTEWMHESNPVAAQALQALADVRGWTVRISDDPAVFSRQQLERTDVVVFSMTSGSVLDQAARTNLEAFFRDGGGFVGIHSASYTELDWAYYRTVVLPVTFKTHPAPENGAPSNVLEGTLRLDDPDDPIVVGLPDPWIRADEFYTFHERPEDLPGAHMLVSLDESTMGPEYPDSVRVGYHALAFRREIDASRMFYTALGHTVASYAEPDFLQMLAQGIAWAGGARYGR